MPGYKKSQTKKTSQKIRRNQLNNATQQAPTDNKLDSPFENMMGSLEISGKTDTLSDTVNPTKNFEHVKLQEIDIHGKTYHLIHYKNISPEIRNTVENLENKLNSHAAAFEHFCRLHIEFEGNNDWNLDAGRDNLLFLVPDSAVQLNYSHPDYQLINEMEVLPESVAVLGYMNTWRCSDKTPIPNFYQGVDDGELHFSKSESRKSHPENRRIYIEYIAAKYQRQGLGSAMITYLKQHGPELAAYMYVMTPYCASISFFWKCGFIEFADFTYLIKCVDVNENVPKAPTQLEDWCDGKLLGNKCPRRYFKLKYSFNPATTQRSQRYSIRPDAEMSERYPQYEDLNEVARSRVRLDFEWCFEEEFSMRCRMTKWLTGTSGRNAVLDKGPQLDPFETRSQMWTFPYDSLKIYNWFVAEAETWDYLPRRVVKSKT